MQWRLPVGGGPSSKTCPRCPPQRRQCSSMRVMNEGRVLACTDVALDLRPEARPAGAGSNFCLGRKSGRSQPAQSNVPLRCSSRSSLVPGRSVDFLAQHRVLLRRQDGAPLLLGLRHLEDFRRASLRAPPMPSCERRGGKPAKAIPESRKWRFVIMGPSLSFAKRPPAPRLAAGSAICSSSYAAAHPRVLRHRSSIRGETRRPLPSIMQEIITEWARRLRRCQLQAQRRDIKSLFRSQACPFSDPLHCV